MQVVPKFIITNKTSGREETVTLDKETITIGRADNCDIVLDGKSVSRKHAEVVRMKKSFFLVDSESGNGTFLNGRKLKPHEKNPLSPNDRFQIEDFNIRFVMTEEAKKAFSEEENTDSDVIEIKMIKKVLSALQTEAHPSLEAIDPPFEGRKVFFTEEMQELVIGRDPLCAFPLDETTVSRRHALLQKKWGGVVVVDLSSKNGTFVNGERVEEKLLKNSDIVMVGSVKLRYRNPQEINLEALSKDYDSSNSLSAPTKEPSLETIAPPPTISKEAQLSVQPDLKEEKKEEKKLEMLPPQFPSSVPEAIEKIRLYLTRFSTLELALLAGGVLVIFFSLIFILSILL